jgi:hypothetical protein
MFTNWKQKWIEALRSGKYRQGQSLLSFTILDEEPQYCCLGVLRDIMGTNDFSYKQENTTLSSLQLSVCGLDRETQRILIQLNDVKMWDFNQIADYIENSLQDKVHQ